HAAVNHVVATVAEQTLAAAASFARRDVHDTHRLDASGALDIGPRCVLRTGHVAGPGRLAPGERAAGFHGRAANAARGAQQREGKNAGPQGAPPTDRMACPYWVGMPDFLYHWYRRPNR